MFNVIRSWFQFRLISFICSGGIFRRRQLAVSLCGLLLYPLEWNLLIITNSVLVVDMTPDANLRVLFLLTNCSNIGLHLNYSY